MELGWLSMKRLNFIYTAAPLTVALNALPGMLDGVWRMLAAGVLALALWAVVWLRVYTTKKLRPEFAIMAVVPALSYHLLGAAGPEYAASFQTPGWQNFNFFLWIASIAVTIRALLPTPQEYKGRLATDSVFIFMTIITVVYGLSCWATTHSII